MQACTLFYCHFMSQHPTSMVLRMSGTVLGNYCNIICIKSVKVISQLSHKCWMNENQRMGSDLKQFIHTKTKVMQFCLICTYFELHRKAEQCKSVYNLRTTWFLKETHNNPASYPTDTTGYYPKSYPFIIKVNPLVPSYCILRLGE